MIFNNKNGFTMVEVMIVIAIIGILAAVAIPSFMSYKAKTFVEENVQVGTYLEGETWEKHLRYLKSTGKYQYYLKEKQLVVDKNGYVRSGTADNATTGSKLEDATVIEFIIEVQVYLLEQMKKNINHKSDYQKYDEIAEIDRYLEKLKKVLTEKRDSRDINP